MSRVERDPERGQAAAAKLKALGVKGILIKAAEQGYITQLHARCPNASARRSLEARATSSRSPTNGGLEEHWMPTLEHFPVSKKEGGKAALDNAILAHRLCNRLDHSLRVGRSHRRDLERIRKARDVSSTSNSILAPPAYWNALRATSDTAVASRV